jgi:hypothetical protein
VYVEEEAVVDHGSHFQRHCHKPKWHHTRYDECLTSAYFSNSNY